MKRHRFDPVLNVHRVTAVSVHEDALDNLEETISENAVVDLYNDDQSFGHEFGTQVAWGIAMDDAAIAIAFPDGTDYDVMPVVETRASGGGCNVPDEYLHRHRCSGACREIDAALRWYPACRYMDGDTLVVEFVAELADEL